MAKLDGFQLFLVSAGKFTPCVSCLSHQILQLPLAQTPLSFPGESAVCNTGLKPTALSGSPPADFNQQD